MLKQFLLPAVLVIPLAGCVYEHPHHFHEQREDVVVYEVEGPPPPLRQEVIVERDRPSRDAVWRAGHWRREPERHRWVWVPGHWNT